MKLIVLTIDGSTVTINDMDQDSVLAMVEAFGDEDQRVMAFEMDDGMTYVNKRNISRIDLTNED